VVFLDADTLVVKNIDRLFGYPEFSAAPNLYETLDDMHRLNSGVFVAQPSAATFADMLARLDAPDAIWRRTDQTFLETYFPHWHGLPYIYNTLQYVYFNLPQLWSWPSIHVVHYQYEKPWDSNHAKRDQLLPLIELWHRIMDGGDIPNELPVQQT
jgi:alpha-N-acetylglucosamine transferase